MRGQGFVIERHPVVIDALFSNCGVIGITAKIFDCRANPRFRLDLIWSERGDPFLGVDGPSRISRTIHANLRPLIVILDIFLGRDVQASQIGDAYHALSAFANTGEEREKKGNQNRDGNERNR